MADYIDNPWAAGPVWDEMSAMFAPVDQYIHVLEGASSAVIGYAAPSSGVKPCAVELAVGDVVIAVSHAGRFSSQANAIGLRYGWCGFKLTGLPLAVALDGSIVVRCAVTQAVLHQFNRDNVPGLSQMSPHIVSAVDLLRELRLANGTVDLNNIAPFIARFGLTHGVLDTVDTLYRYLLGRPVDDSGKATWADRLESGMTPTQLADTLWRIRNEEMLNVPVILRGPFEPGFPFGLALYA